VRRKMPFKESTRNWWLRVSGGECEYEYYDDKRGWQNCDNKADHVHHITPESKLLHDGEDPERATGMPLCIKHHVKGEEGIIYDAHTSFHPDVGKAYKSYHEWKQAQLHMNEIGGRRRSTDYSTSPFADVAKEHAQKARRGERICNGDEGSDQHFREKMKAKASTYSTLHPEDSKPRTKAHPQYAPEKKKHWWDAFFGKEDE
jgi:hypothetical protein